MKKKIKTIFIAAAAAGIAMMNCMTCFAYGWFWGGNGTLKYGTNEDNSQFYHDEWQWLDKNGDGLTERYYFWENGMIAMEGDDTAPDGSQLKDGAWAVNGEIQHQGALLPKDENFGVLTYNYDQYGLNKDVAKLLDGSIFKAGLRYEADSFSYGYLFNSMEDHTPHEIIDCSSGTYRNENGRVCSYIDSTNGTIHYKEGFTVGYTANHKLDYIEGGATSQSNIIIPDKGMEKWIFQHFDPNIKKEDIPAYLESLGYVRMELNNDLSNDEETTTLLSVPTYRHSIDRDGVCRCYITIPLPDDYLSDYLDYLAEAKLEGYLGSYCRIAWYIDENGNAEINRVELGACHAPKSLYTTETVEPYDDTNSKIWALTEDELEEAFTKLGGFSLWN